MLHSSSERKLNPEWYLKENFKVSLLHSNKPWCKWCSNHTALIITNHQRLHSQRILQNILFQENNFLTQLVNVTNMLALDTESISGTGQQVLLTRFTKQSCPSMFQRSCSYPSIFSLKLGAGTTSGLLCWHLSSSSARCKGWGSAVW